MQYFTGENLRNLLVKKGLSFRGTSRALNLSKEQMNELLTCPKMQTSILREINEKLNLGIQIDTIHIHNPSQLKNKKSKYFTLIGNARARKFWEVVEFLASKNKIIYGKDFFIEDGFLYIRLCIAHPLYIKELQLRKDPNVVISERELRRCLSSDKNYFLKNCKKRFPGESRFTGSLWCSKFKYSALGIDLSIQCSNDLPC